MDSSFQLDFFFFTGSLISTGQIVFIVFVFFLVFFVVFFVVVYSYILICRLLPFVCGFCFAFVSFLFSFGQF